MVDAIEKLNQKSNDKELKVNFATDQKFKMDNEPILAAIAKVQKAFEDAKAKESAGETNKLLADMLKEMKKKK